MCITGGVAKRNRRIHSLPHKAPQGRDVLRGGEKKRNIRILTFYNLAPAGLEECGELLSGGCAIATPPVMHITPLRGYLNSRTTKLSTLKHLIR
jgi:hypothetical protein